MANEQVEDAVIDTEDKDFATSFEEHIRAGYQCIYIPTSEESRVELEISRIAKKLKYGIITWDCVDGFSAEALKQDKKYRLPVEALRGLGEDNLVTGANNMFIFRDLDDYQADPLVRRLIRSLCEGNKLVNKRHKRPLIVISPKLQIHDKLKTAMSVLEFSLPNESRLERTFKFVQSSVQSKDKHKIECSDDLRDKIVACLMGLTSTEAENALARCLVRHSGFTEDILGTIKDEKAQIIKKSEVLTYIPETGMATRDEIGGFDRLMTWLDRRRLSYTKEARNENIDFPKGIVLLGVPGTGKSVVGKAVAKLLGLPGYIMDVGAVFGHLVGESEQRMRDAIAQIEAQKGCVLLVDEADKAFGGAADAQGDSGVTRRVFGKFLTWLAEKQDRTFVIMTMNRTKGIPPEFLRAGRFDAVFYTDLPGDAERRQILEIHFKKRMTLPLSALQLADADWAAIVDKTKGFVGSELEEVVREARYRSFESRKSGIPIFEEIMGAAASIVPMSTRDEALVNEIRTFCKDAAIPVTSQEKPTRAKSAGRESRAVDVDR